MAYAELFCESTLAGGDAHPASSSAATRAAETVNFSCLMAILCPHRKTSLNRDGDAVARGTIVFLVESIYEQSSTTPIPEPDIHAMMLTGLGLLGWVGRVGNRKPLGLF